MRKQRGMEQERRKGEERKFKEEIQEKEKRKEAKWDDGETRIGSDDNKG